MNDVAPLVQMKLPSANDVMLRINDVSLRQMILRFAQTEFSRAFHVFRGKKHTFFTIADFYEPFGLGLSTLLEHIEIIESL